MNNFFYDSSDYNLFKKALRKTGGEPVVINILSTDSSLKKDDEKKQQKVERKNFSNRFEPSPFGKFFGPQKKRQTSVDTNSFSSWKNKNYRKTEQSINENSDSGVKFSLSDFMNDKFGKSKFNELDEVKSSLQKPINQLSSDDPQYKKFSLDSFMSKLEQQRKVEEELKENDDILEPLGEEESKDSIVPDSSQDEDFGFGSETTVESVAFDDNISGEKFTFERSELDKIKNRLIKIEEEQANLKKRGNERVLEGNEISDMANDEFDLSKLGFEEEEESSDEELNKNTKEEKLEDNFNLSTLSEESLNENADKENYDSEDSENLNEESEYINEESNQNETSTDSEGAEVEENIADEIDENNQNDSNLSEVNEESELSEDNDISELDETANESDVEEDSMEDKQSQLMQTISEKANDEVEYISDDNKQQYDEALRLQQQQAEMQARILELIESNKKNDKLTEERIRQAEFEKQQIEREYAIKLKEIEESYNRRYEEYKKQAYLGKLEEEAKIRSLEQNFAKSVEKSDISRKSKKANLKNELKTNLEKSNIEMDKKLLEIASAQNKNEKIQHRRNNAIKNSNLEEETIKNNESNKKSGSLPNIDISLPKKQTRQRRKKSSRRRIDGDIITDIDFE